MESKEQIIQRIVGDITQPLHDDIWECMTAYAAQQTATLQAENERLRGALKKIAEQPQSKDTDTFKQDVDIIVTIATAALNGKG